MVEGILNQCGTNADDVRSNLCQPGNFHLDPPKRRSLSDFQICVPCNAFRDEQNAEYNTRLINTNSQDAPEQVWMSHHAHTSKGGNAESCLRPSQALLGPLKSSCSHNSTALDTLTMLKKVNILLDADYRTNLLWPQNKLKRKRRPKRLAKLQSSRVSKRKHKLMGND